jgi:aerobic carbon-monoxide dehydrogenase medium subunit
MYRIEPVGPIMKPPPFEYHDPKSVAEAIAILRSHSNAKLLAGGQSLMPMLNMRFVQPDHVIDLNKIEALSYIREENNFICIGAMTRQRELEFSPLVRERLPLMYEALLAVGHRQTRNRGTIGGSLCHLDPAAELPAVAMAYDAFIEVSGKDGARAIPMADFAAFYMTPAIEPDEIVTGLRFTPWPKGHGSAFVEFARRHGDFALASVGALIELDGRVIRRASITVGGLSHKPTRVAEAEHAVAAEQAGDITFRKAAEACGTIEAIADIHGSAAYRQKVAKTLAFRALSTAHSRALSSRSGRPT